MTEIELLVRDVEWMLERVDERAAQVEDLILLCRSERDELLAVRAVLVEQVELARASVPA